MRTLPQLINDLNESKSAVKRVAAFAIKYPLEFTIAAITSIVFIWLVTRPFAHLEVPLPIVDSPFRAIASVGTPAWMIKARCLLSGERGFED